ncbi:unnamed protein product [Dicrocoelium dendriticum]|nr:unnamed protein product [Dicrocoelium dendriticum]
MTCPFYPANIWLQFFYQPTVSGEKHVGFFKLKTCNNFGEILVKCSGRSMDANVRLSTLELVFDATASGRVTQKSFHVVNQCELPVTYEIICGPVYCKTAKTQTCSTAFPILDGAVNGVVDKGQRVRVVIGFAPNFPGHYFRRIALLVSGQEPQFLNLHGSCHSGDHQPHEIALPNQRNDGSMLATNEQLQTGEANSRCDYQPRTSMESGRTRAFEQYVELRGLHNSAVSDAIL